MRPDRYRMEECVKCSIFSPRQQRRCHSESQQKNDVQGKDAANKVHYDAGVVVRRAIAELGGTMPEALPTVDSIKKLEQARKKHLKAAQKLKNPEQ